MQNDLEVMEKLLSDNLYPIIGKNSYIKVGFEPNFYYIEIRVRWFQFNQQYGIRYVVADLRRDILPHIAKSIYEKVKYEVGKNEYEYGTLA